MSACTALARSGILEGEAETEEQNYDNYHYYNPGAAATESANKAIIHLNPSNSIDTTYYGLRLWYVT